MSHSMLRAAVGLTLLALPFVAAADPTDVPTLKVRYEDLNIQSAAGSKALYQRIASAADVVCGKLAGRDLTVVAARTQCQHEAIAHAVSDVNTPALTAYYNARNPGKALLSASQNPVGQAPLEANNQ